MRRGPSRSRWGDRRGEGWPRWNKGPRWFGAFAAEEGTQEGAAGVGVGAAPPRAVPRSWSLDTAGDSPNCGPSSGVLLPRPTPHPRSGAQDGAVRPEVFCSVAAGHHAGHCVALVRLWAANDGSLRGRDKALVCFKRSGVVKRGQRSEERY